MTKSKYLGSVALGAMLAMVGAGTAQAVPAYAYATLGFTNFTLTGLFDAQGNAATGVTGLSTAVTMTDSANYPGYPTTGAAAAPGTITTGVDAPQATSGPGAFPGENVFTQALNSGQAGTRGDGAISGPLASGATSNVVAEGNLALFGASAGSSAGSSTTVSATFTALAKLTVTLSANAIAHMIASIGTAGDSASAQISATYSITDITNPGSLVQICDTLTSSCTNTSVNPLAANGAVTTNLTGFSPDVTLSASYNYVANLTAGDQYVLTMQDSATELLSTAAAVPEPASLTVIGIGLMGLAGVARRRKI